MIRLTNDVGSMLYELIGAILAGGRMPDQLRGLDWTTVRQSILEQREAPDHAADLVDVISEHLVNGSSRGGIVGDSLRRMQRAILLPSELAKLKAMGAGVPTCADCRRTLMSYELVINTTDGRLLCINCEMPRLVPMTTCGRHRGMQIDMREIPAKALRAIRSVQKVPGDSPCQLCVQEASAQPTENVQITPGALGITADDFGGGAPTVPQTVTGTGSGLGEVVQATPPTFRFRDDPRLGGPGERDDPRPATGRDPSRLESNPWDELRLREEQIRASQLRVDPSRPPGGTTTQEAPRTGRREPTFWEITRDDSLSQPPQWMVGVGSIPTAPPVPNSLRTADVPEYRPMPRPMPRMSQAEARRILATQAENAEAAIRRQAMVDLAHAEIIARGGDDDGS